MEADLYEEIKKQPEQEAGRIASALELYVKGSLNVFNHHTNVDISNRIVCFDINWKVIFRKIYIRKSRGYM